MKAAKKEQQEALVAVGDTMRQHIYRDHLFTNRLNLVVQNENGTYSLFHEKTVPPVVVSSSISLDVAFIREDWDVFVRAEAQALHGEVTL